MKNQFMKIIIIITIILGLGFSAFCIPYPDQSNSKTFQIHKSKRVFVEKKDRLYLKKKNIENNKHKQSGDNQKKK